MRNDRGGRRDFGSRSFTAPVKVGDELDVVIDAVGEKGDGIAKKDGFVLFVPGTKKDDKVKIKVTRVLPKVGFAEVIGKKEEGEEPAEAEAGEGQAEEESYESSAEEPGQSSEDSENFGEESEENQ